MTDRQERFGERLRRLREAAGYSQEGLAERAGLSANAISALERGERKRPFPDTLRRLADALGLDEAARADLVAAVRSGQEPGGPGVADGSGSRPAATLPGEPTPLIGRARETEVVRHLLARQAEGRLLTLLGPGGVGKTRLALRVAREVASRYPDGVTWVELAPVGDPALVLSAIAQALGLEKRLGRDAGAELRHFLRDRQVLLVLDNVEHVLDATPAIAALLHASPGLTILATSRAPLGIQGEQEYVVPPLELPPAAPAPVEGDVAGASSVELFTWYARQKRPSFAVTAENAAAVAAICRRLDGLPLALELAAARARYLQPEELLARLDEALQGAGARSLPERQRTLRATLDWSYRLLAEPERALLRRLAVFAGGFTLESAEAVGADDGDAPGGVLGRLGTLVEQSLVTVAADDAGTRYGLLEPIRQDALRRLEASGELDHTRQRHAQCCLELAERAAVEIEGHAEQVRWLGRLDREQDNLRAALAWAERAPDGAELGLRLAKALWRWWEVRGFTAEGGRWLAAMLERADGVSPAVVANALNAAGNLARDRTEYELATRYHERALAIRREIGDRHGIAASLNNLGVIARDRGDAERTTRLCTESLALFREVGDPHRAAIALISLGMAASQRGDHDRAREHYEEGLAYFHASGDSWHSAWMRTHLARLAVRQGRVAEARRNAEEGLALYRATGDPWGISLALGALGWVAQAEGDLDTAAGRFAEALDLVVEAGVERVVPPLLEDLAGVALARGDALRAARLGGAAARLREISGEARTGGDGGTAAVDLPALHAAQPAAWEEGRAMDRRRVLAEVAALTG